MLPINKAKGVKNSQLYWRKNFLIYERIFITAIISSSIFSNVTSDSSASTVVSLLSSSSGKIIGLEKKKKIN